MEGRKYLVVGGRGLVGGAVVAALRAAGEQVVPLSRTVPPEESPSEWCQLDLTDRVACATVLSEPRFQGVTHIVYAALYERPELISGWQHEEQMATNLAMLTNLLDHLQPGHHLALLQGTKAYGAHVAPMSLPGKEESPRHPHENFYWLQEDLVRERAAAQGWRFSILRPQVVCGIALNSPMNLVNALAVYGSLAQAAELPFALGGDGTHFVTEMVSADLLARAIVWTGQHEVAAGETYNVTNGDVVHWPTLWPQLAEYFAVASAHQPGLMLTQQLPPFAEAWQSLVRNHDLKLSMDHLVGSSWQFADAVLGHGGGGTTLLSTIKLRQHGFNECMDTTTMFYRQFDRLREMRWIP